MAKVTVQPEGDRQNTSIESIGTWQSIDEWWKT